MRGARESEKKRNVKWRSSKQKEMDWEKANCLNLKEKLYLCRKCGSCCYLMLYTPLACTYAHTLPHRPRPGTHFTSIIELEWRGGERRVEKRCIYKMEVLEEGARAEFIFALVMCSKTTLPALFSYTLPFPLSSFSHFFSPSLWSVQRCRVIV